MLYEPGMSCRLYVCVNLVHCVMFCWQINDDDEKSWYCEAVMNLRFLLFRAQTTENYLIKFTALEHFHLLRNLSITLTV